MRRVGEQVPGGPCVRTHSESENTSVLEGRVARQRLSTREPSVVSGSWDGTVRIWDAGSGQPIGEPLTGHTGSVMAVALGSVAGREVIVSGGGDGTVRIWDPVNTDAVSTFDVFGRVKNLELAQQGITCFATMGPALCKFAISTQPDPSTR